MSFTIETEQNNKFYIFPGKGKFTASVFRKPTFGGAYINFDNF